MGEHQVSNLKTQEERRKFLEQLIEDIDVLEILLKDKMFESGIQRVGAEQEFALINKSFRPSDKAMDILNDINDDHFTTELAKFNLELNLDPYVLKDSCFSTIEKDLKNYLLKAADVARKFDTRILLTGILPTIAKSHLSANCMTPVERYIALDQSLRRMRKEDFRIYIQGMDELSITHDSVLFEACNTSWQMHLQIEADEFVDNYNWAQMISGPVLSVCTNSPLLLGKQLWRETRIALFQQSIDTRGVSSFLKERQARVNFGNGWVRNSILEIFRDEAVRFPLIISSEISNPSMEILKSGKIPDLKALRLHNGTLYKWNRPCYGCKDGVAHLRIECRYIPSGPSITDEIANFVFWTGLMKAIPEDISNISQQVEFYDAKNNFIKAARYGLGCIQRWYGKDMSARDLILDTLLPLSESALKKTGLKEDDITHYLSIIEARVKSGKTGSEWMLDNYQKMKKSLGEHEALVTLTAGMYARQDTQVPVHEWDEISPDEGKDIPGKVDKVRRIMTVDIFRVHEDDPLSLARRTMEWKKIRHVPVENSEGELTGLITLSLLDKINGKDEKSVSVKDVMITKLYIIDPDATLENAIDLLRINKIDCLPVMRNGHLLGIVTDTDIKKLTPFY